MQTQRIDINTVTPGAYQSLIQLDKYVTETNLPKSLYHLIKVRASLINGCALCIQSHSNDALAGGETSKRLLALNAWADSPYFTNEERAVLTLTDETTLISENGVSNETFNEAVQILGEEKVSHAIMAIACINAWNRIGRATLLIPQ
ncbi:carboxymuconolactone decarboxylase family protein [Flavobacterium sp. HJJ]|uniref:carboxymuconolactone decarboxylase family protein n=1 Tax=Flavobacterium sp. HJJ TaxID=2783792 RepID=UPI00188A8935|nr:carboxymuconolactone decarboxylase family protein [Flavobacterium sp. HJJ]MBF4473132.1 carboxymuconolactone decarboxylase family protein [Flavobacterium sp. HJJ]